MDDQVLENTENLELQLESADFNVNFKISTLVVNIFDNDGK